MNPYSDYYDTTKIDITDFNSMKFGPAIGSSSTLRKYQNGCELNILVDWNYLIKVNYVETDPRCLKLLSKWADEFDVLYAKFGEMSVKIASGADVGKDMDALYAASKYPTIAKQFESIKKSFKSKVIKNNSTIRDVVYKLNKASIREKDKVNAALQSPSMNTNNVVQYNYNIIYNNIVGSATNPSIWNLQHSIFVKIV